MSMPFQTWFDWTFYHRPPAPEDPESERRRIIRGAVTKLRVQMFGRYATDAARDAEVRRLVGEEEYDRYVARDRVPPGHPDDG